LVRINSLNSYLQFSIDKLSLFLVESESSTSIIKQRFYILYLFKYYILYKNSFYTSLYSPNTISNKDYLYLLSLMSKSLSEIASSTISHRNKTDRLQTQASELYIPFTSRRVIPETPTYLRITATKTNISLSRGYLDLQRRKKRA
jgi:hypothetical protein